MFLPKKDQKEDVTSMQHGVEILASALQQEKEIKGTHIERKKVKLSLFTDNMITYIEYLMASTKKAIRTEKEFSKIAGYVTNTQAATNWKIKFKR